MSFKAFHSTLHQQHMAILNVQITKHVREKTMFYVVINKTIHSYHTRMLKYTEKYTVINAFLIVGNFSKYCLC